MPIIISEQAMELDEEKMMELQENMSGTSDDAYSSEKKVYVQKSIHEEIMHNNILDKEYIDYIENINPELLSGISYTRATSLNIISKNKNTYKPLSLSQMEFINIPKNINGDNNVLKENYDLLYGAYPKEENELLLVLDNKNRVSEKILSALDLDVSKESFDFKENPRVITSSYPNINERYYNYLLMDWAVHKIPRYYFNETTIQDLINKVKQDKEEKVNKYGMRNYTIYVNTNRLDTENQNGFWKQAKLI